MALSSSQRLFVVAVVGGRKIKDAAAFAGVSERSGQRYMKLPEVRQAVEAGTIELAGLVSAGMVRLLAQAMDTLAEVMEHGDKDGPRVSAAVCVVGSAVKLAGIGDDGRGRESEVAALFWERVRRELAENEHPAGGGSRPGVVG